MPAALGPRFVLEAGFLILLAVVVGIADLRPALIVLVMALAWVLVALIEYIAWRQSLSFSMMRRGPAGVAEPAPVAIQEEVVEDVPPPPPPPPPPPAAEEATVVEPPRPEEPPAETGAAADEPGTQPDEALLSFADAELATDAERPTEFRPEPERKISHRLEPLRPRPRRRWIVFGPRDRSEDDREEER